MVTDIGEIKHYRTETFKVFLFMNFPYYSHLILLKVYQNQADSLWIKETLIIEVILRPPQFGEVSLLFGGNIQILPFSWNYHRQKLAFLFINVLFMNTCCLIKYASNSCSKGIYFFQNLQCALTIYAAWGKPINAGQSRYQLIDNIL